jgi:salicylate hydroxylase
MGGPPKVAIIGSEIAGVAAALALFRRGVEGAVYGQAGELSDIGASAQMTPNAKKALFSLGLERATMRIAFQPEARFCGAGKAGG